MTPISMKKEENPRRKINAGGLGWKPPLGTGWAP